MQVEQHESETPENSGIGGDEGANTYFSICYTPLAMFLESAEAALLVQRLHYWQQNKYSGYLLKDGTKWIYNGYKEIQEQFPWLSVDQIGRHIRYLERLGWLQSDRFYNLKRGVGFATRVPHFQEDNQRKWYRLDYQQIFNDTGFDLLFNRERGESSPPPERRKRPRAANRQNCRLQSASLHNTSCKNAQSSIYKEFQINTKDLSLEEREKGNSSARERGCNLDVVECQPQEQELESNQSQGNLNPNEDKCSARSYDVNHHEVRHKRKPGSLGGFTSQEEMNGFYHALLQLGEHKSSVYSPVAWARGIVKSVKDGEPCEYLNEFRRGEPAGIGEKQEWENAPGQVYPQFQSYLRQTLRTNQMTDEQSIAAVHRALRDTSQAKALWASFKRRTVNTKDQWEKDSARGVKAPYIPHELMPDAEVSFEEAAMAMEYLSPDQAEALPAVEVALPEDADQNQEDAERKVWIERMRDFLKSGNKAKVVIARAWAQRNPDIVEPVFEDGVVVDVVEVDKQSLSQSVQPIGCGESSADLWAEETEAIAPDPAPKVGDRVFVNTCPHTDKHGPFAIERIEGKKAKVEMFPHLIPLSDLRQF